MTGTVWCQAGKHFCENPTAESCRECYVKRKEESMRTRDKKYSDYGLDPDTAERLREECQNLSDADSALLLSCAETACGPGMAPQIVRSLTTGESYDRIRSREYIPAKRDDFYAYRRSTLAAFWRMKCGDTEKPTE